MVDEMTVKKAIETLLDAAPPGSLVICFGSYAKGTAGPNSDLDFLIVEPTIRDRAGEMVRLRLALDKVIGPLLIPADVLVVSRERFEHWRETPGNVYYEAAKDGRAYERSA